MGIDVDDSLMVGCSYDELEDFIQQTLDKGELNDIQDILEEYFEYASPYYDASREHCFYGFQISNYKIPDEDWFDEVWKTAKQFEALTGVKARIRGGAHVW